MIVKLKDIQSMWSTQLHKAGMFEIPVLYAVIKCYNTADCKAENVRPGAQHVCILSA